MKVSVKKAVFLRMDVLVLHRSGYRSQHVYSCPKR